MLVLLGVLLAMSPVGALVVQLVILVVVSLEALSLVLILPVGDFGTVCLRHTQSEMEMTGRVHIRLTERTGCHMKERAARAPFWACDSVDSTKETTTTRRQADRHAASYTRGSIVLFSMGFVTSPRG